MAIPFSDEDLIPAVEGVLKKVEPTLALDGGGVKLIAIKNGVIYVQLLGGCIGCASSHLTIKYTIEKQLRADIHPELTVINVPVGMEDRLDELK